MTPGQLDCALVSRLVGAWQDGELAEADRERFEEHLLVCPPCLDLNDNLQRARAALRVQTVLPPPDDLVQRVLAFAGELEGA